MLCFVAAFVCTQLVPHRLENGQKSWLSISSASKLSFAVRETLAYVSSKDSVSVPLANPGFLKWSLSKASLWKSNIPTVQEMGDWEFLIPLEKECCLSTLYEVTGWSTRKLCWWGKGFFKGLSWVHQHYFSVCCSLEHIDGIAWRQQYNGVQQIYSVILKS